MRGVFRASSRLYCTSNVSSSITISCRIPLTLEARRSSRASHAKSLSLVERVGAAGGRA